MSDHDSQEFFNQVMDKAEAELKPWRDFQAACAHRDRPVRIGRLLPLCLKYGCLCGQGYCPDFPTPINCENSTRQEQR